MKSMDDIYKSYAGTVYKYLLSLTRDGDLAEELTQETFYQAIRSIDRYDESSCRISTWLCAIAKNVLATYRRKNRQHEDLDAALQGSARPVNATETAASSEDELIRAEERTDLIRKVHSLDEPYREVVYLRAFGGLSFREIGDVFGKTENWARVTFYRGKEKLRSSLDR